MIPRSAEANRRSSPTRSRHRSGHGNHEPLRSFLFGGPWSRTSRDAVSSANCARGTRDKKEQNASENHDRIGRGPVRRNAPSSAPSRHLRPTLLQHERLHQLSHRRLRDRSRSLRDLRLHPPTQLTAGASAPPHGPCRPGPPGCDAPISHAAGNHLSSQLIRFRTPESDHVVEPT